jgi:hypothetical protein
MLSKQDLRAQLEALEASTVSDSFGAPSLGGRAPDFNFSPILAAVTLNAETIDVNLSSALRRISEQGFDDVMEYIVKSAGRFAFCIELTNLKITSTKNKTRWMEAKIVKTKPGTFQNYQGWFRPSEDPRSSTFDECFELFVTALTALSKSVKHLNILRFLSTNKHRGIPYESVFTYCDFNNSRIHLANNFRLVEVKHIEWLIKARPIFHSVLRTDSTGKLTKVVEKIKTKSYKTDRSQTGEVQTNRAKRWECISLDFQHASLEECWSVERKLLEDICNFEQFPADKKIEILNLGLIASVEVSRCPITLKKLNFNDLLAGGEHGESKFQVGHLEPLKSGGRHCGSNIAWISDDGNRIQGSLSIHETQTMLKEIFSRMNLSDY